MSKAETCMKSLVVDRLIFWQYASMICQRNASEYIVGRHIIITIRLKTNIASEGRVVRFW